MRNSLTKRTKEKLFPEDDEFSSHSIDEALKQPLDSSNSNENDNNDVTEGKQSRGDASKKRRGRKASAKSYLILNRRQSVRERKRKRDSEFLYDVSRKKKKLSGDSKSQDEVAPVGRSTKPSDSMTKNTKSKDLNPLPFLMPSCAPSNKTDITLGKYLELRGMKKQPYPKPLQIEKPLLKVNMSGNKELTDNICGSQISDTEPLLDLVKSISSITGQSEMQKSIIPQVSGHSNHIPRAEESVIRNPATFSKRTLKVPANGNSYCVLASSKRSKGCTDKEQVDFKQLRSLSQLGIDVKFLDDIERDLNIQTKLNIAGNLISELNKIQTERLSQGRRNASTGEKLLAGKVMRTLVILMKLALPGQVAPSMSVFKALGFDFSS